MTEDLDDHLLFLLQYIDEARIIAAKDKYDKIMGILQSNEDHEVCKKFKQKIDQVKEKIDRMINRYDDVSSALSATPLDGNEWILGSHYFGVTTHYKLESDGLISVRLEGEQENIPLFEVLSVIYEVELYKEWVPFCNGSDLLQRLTHTELLMQGSISVPIVGVSRDAVLHAYAVDCLYEHGAIVVIGSSIDHADDVGCDVPIPPISSSFFHDRADIKYFRAVVNVESPYSAKAIITCQIDPKLKLPQFVINFVMQKLAGVLLHFLTKQAMHISENFEGTLYAEKIQSNREFYVEWLLPKFRAYLNHCGWEHPLIKCLQGFDC